jgi:hypothetical protein
VFPRGLPVGQVKMVREGRGGKEVVVEPSGLWTGMEEMLIVLDGVHSLIPAPDEPASREVSILPAPPTENGAPATALDAAPATDADRLRERYQRVVEGQGVRLGVKGAIADFNRAPAPKPASAPEASAAPPSNTPPPPAAAPSKGAEPGKQ